MDSYIDRTGRGLLRMWKHGQTSLFTYGPRPQDWRSPGDLMRRMQLSIEEAKGQPGNRSPFVLISNLPTGNVRIGTRTGEPFTTSEQTLWTEVQEPWR